jgi:hypothetical protein
VKAALVLENKLWVDTTLPLDPAFTARLPALASEAFAVNFAHLDREQVALSAFLAKINRPRNPPRYGPLKVKPADTNDTTRSTFFSFSLFDSLFTETNGLAVINGAWLKGEWENKFPRENTRAAPFHQLGSDVAVDVQMMSHSSVSVAHGTFEHHTMVSLPYEASLLRLLVLLPHVNSAEALVAVRGLRVV